MISCQFLAMITDTADGTGVRDYIHVVDLAYAHVLALNHRLRNRLPCLEYWYRQWDFCTANQGYL